MGVYEDRKGQGWWVEYNIRAIKVIGVVAVHTWHQYQVLVLCRFQQWTWVTWHRICQRGTFLLTSSWCWFWARHKDILGVLDTAASALHANGLDGTPPSNKSRILDDGLGSCCSCLSSLPAWIRPCCLIRWPCSSTTTWCHRFYLPRWSRVYLSGFYVRKS